MRRGRLCNARPVGPAGMGKPNPDLNPHVRKAARFKSEKP